jgi:hypothetical protein
MKQRAIIFALLLISLVAVLTLGGAAVKSGADPAWVGGIEVVALALTLVGGGLAVAKSARA